MNQASQFEFICILHSIALICSSHRETSSIRIIELGTKIVIHLCCINQIILKTALIISLEDEGRQGCQVMLLLCHTTFFLRVIH